MSDDSPAANLNDTSPERRSATNRTRGSIGLASDAKILLITIALGFAFFFGLRYLVENWASESTDDAFIDGHVVAISSKVAGEAIATHVTENQEVKAGDVLVEVDPRPLQARVNQKLSALDSARASQRAFEAGFEWMRAHINTAEATHKQTEAEAEASKVTYDNAQSDWKRALGIWTNGGHGAISEQDYDAAKARMSAAKASWQAAVDKAASDASKVIEARVQLSTAEKLYEGAGAQVSLAQADLDAANLDHSYAKITAPVDGRVTRKIVEKGAYLQVGQNLLALVRPEIWVTANFKETQTAEIRPGQPVNLHVDGAGNRAFHGHVQSLQSGSGARFSLLPPENAVGNYVKVVQRVPVRIDLDERVQAIQGLGPGMSVVPSVQIGKPALSQAMVAVIAALLAIIIGAIMGAFVRRNARH